MMAVFMENIDGFSEGPGFKLEGIYCNCQAKGATFMDGLWDSGFLYTHLTNIKTS